MSLASDMKDKRAATKPAIKSDDKKLKEELNLFQKMKEV